MHLGGAAPASPLPGTRLQRSTPRASPRGGVSIPSEPYSEDEVRRVCEALRQQPGFQSWYRDLNAGRQAIRFRELPTDIKGISTTLEDLSPAADVHITRFVNRIEAAKIRVDVSARSPSDASVNAAQDAERFHYSFLNDITRQRSQGILSPYRRHLDDQAALGAGFLHLSLKPSVRKALGSDFKDVDEMVAAAKKAFDKGFTENPYMVECPALETVFFEPDLSTVCEVGERTIAQVLQSYQGLSYTPNIGFEWLTSDTMPQFESFWQDTVTYYHLETGEFIYDLLYGAQFQDGKPFLLERRPNPAGRPWYTITPGHVNNHPSPDKRFQPLVAAVYPTVQILNVTRTLLQSGALNTGRPMYQEVAIGGKGQTLPEIMNQPAAQRPFIVFDPSQQVLRNPRKDMRWELVPQPSPEWLIAANQQSQRDLQDWGFPVGLSPEAPTGAQANSGYQAAQQMEVATNYLDPALRNVARSLQELLLLTGDVTLGIGLPVTIPIRERGEDSQVRESVTIRPDDFKEQDIEVRLESVPATARVAMRESNLRMLQLGTMSHTTFMKSEYDDYLAEGKRILIDKAYAFAEQKALETVQQFIVENSQRIAAQIAAEQEIPLPPLAPMEGGPEEPGMPRFAKAPDAAMPGAGAANPVPVQAAPPGTEQIAVAP